MKEKEGLNTRITRVALGTAICTALAACGGGSGSGNNPPATGNAQITGKAIDGYISGATVCFDNGQGACDPSQSSATTDASGNYTLPVSGSVAGKQIDVLVTAQSKDVSNGNTAFPSTFMMSAVVQGSSKSQNITPLTSMVVAQMQAGLSQAQADSAVQALAGQNVDLNADYVANGDSATASLASQTVSTLMQFASHGAVSALTGRNVLNAMIAAGSATVTQAQVDTQAALPVYSVVDASQTLANPMFTLVDSANTLALGIGVTQAIRQIANNALQITYQTYAQSGWAALPSGTLPMYADPSTAFVMKSDGSWSDLLTYAQLTAPQPLSAIGSVLTGTDSNTGIGFTYEERSIDLSGQPMALAVSNEIFGPDVSIYGALGGSFAAGTTGYMGIQTYSTDRVVLPVGMQLTCDFPYLTGDTCPFGDPSTTTSTPYNPNQPVNDPKLPTLTSIQQLVGLTLHDPLTNADITISANGQAQFSLADLTQPTTFNATWSTYARNPNVMVFNIPAAQVANIINSSWIPAWPIGQGASLVFAIRNGQLQTGMLFPAGYADKSIQFSKNVNSVFSF